MHDNITRADMFDLILRMGDEYDAATTALNNTALSVITSDHTQLLIKCGRDNPEQLKNMLQLVPVDGLARTLRTWRENSKTGAQHGQNSS